MASDCDLLAGIAADKRALGPVARGHRGRHSSHTSKAEVCDAPDGVADADAIAAGTGLYGT